MNPRPIKVKPLEDYKLQITFQNLECKIFDAKRLLDLPMYQELNNWSFFKTVKADGMCVFWNDDIDICPDILYESSYAVEEMR